MPGPRWDDKLGFVRDPETGELTDPDQPDPVQEAPFDARQVEELARNSLDFLAALAMPTIFKYLFPDTYKAIWTWLLSFVHKSREFPQLVLGLPRGFAKTTFVKIFILYVILFTNKKFILIMAATEKKSVGIVSDIMDFLNEPNIKKVFGDWTVGAESDNQTLKKFGFRGRNITIAAATVSTARGINVKHERPDVMVFDDIQSREDADSEVISKQIETDMIGTAMKAKSPHGCMFLFLGNMYPTKWSILRRLKTNPGWTKFIAGGILADGTSLWEELQPIKQLINEFQNDLSMGRPEIFYAEVLNDENATVNNLIDVTKIPPYPFEPNEIPVGKFIVIDPSSKDSAESDAVTVAYFEVMNIKPVCREIKEGRMSPMKTIQTAITMALKYNCTLVVIESNAYQATLGYWMNFICLQMGIIGLNPQEMYSGALSKITRILNAFKEILEGELIIHPDCMAQVTMQITGYNPLRRNNTDGILDCLTYAPRVVAEMGHFLVVDNIFDTQEFDSIRIRDVIENSAF